MQIGYSILVLKRITYTAFLLLTVIPAFCIATTFIYFVKSVWERPEEGYGLLPIILTAMVFLISFMLISMALMRAFNFGTREQVRRR